MASLFSRTATKNQQCEEPKSDTPILELLEPLPKPIDRIVTGKFAFPFLTFVFMMIFLDNFSFLVVPFGCLLLCFLTVAVHELGHFIAGYLVGFTFRGVEVGPLCLKRIRGVWSFTFRPRIYRGLVAMTPDNPRRIRKRLAICILGGPAISYAAALTAFIVGETHRMTDLYNWTTFLEFFAAFSLWTGILSTIPFRTSAGGNDAFLLHQLFHSKEKATRMIAGYALIAALDKCEVTPEFYARWTKLAAAIEPPLYPTYYTDFNSYRDAEDDVEAGKCLERLLRQYSGLDTEIRNHFIVEAAYFTAYKRSNVTQAEVWRSRIPKPEWLSRLDKDRIEIAYLCAQKRYDEALSRCNSAIDFMHPFVRGPVAMKFEADWLEWPILLKKKSVEGLANEYLTETVIAN